MRCPSCQTACLETDTICLNCRRPLKRQPAERSAANVCGFLFAAVGAGALAFGPAITSQKLSPAVLAGLGMVAGGIVGMAVGLLLDWVNKRWERPTFSAPAPRMHPSARH